MQLNPQSRYLLAAVLMLIMVVWGQTSSRCESETLCKKFDTGDVKVGKDRKWYIRALGNIDETGTVEGNVVTKCDEDFWGFSASSKLRLLDSNKVALTPDISLESYGVNARWIPGFTSARIDTFKTNVDATVFSRMASAELTPVYGLGHDEFKRRVDFVGLTLSKYWFLLIFALGVGCISTFLDLYSFFGYRGTTGTILSDFPSLVFIVANGLLASIFVYLALDQKNSDFNSFMPANASDWTKTVIISFGVPIILKSKLFNFGDERKPVGLVVIYDFILDNVRQRLYAKILTNVEKTSKIFDDLCTENPQLPSELSKQVKLMSELYLSEEALKALDEKLSAITKDYEQSRNSAELVRVSARFVGIDTVRNWIETHCKK